MRMLLVMFLGLAICAVGVSAGEYLLNDTGLTAEALRVRFEAPVEVTQFGDTLTAIRPETESDEFLFLGGVVQPWGGQWLNWAPVGIEILDVEWI